MRILLTNDDGYDAPGIHAAYRAIREFGEVCVIAPRTERSACSHMLSLHRRITVERFEHDEFGLMYVVDGTPADCVRLAVGALLKSPVDRVVAGINQGANTGVDVFYSGTVAAAREATMIGLPAIAFSYAVRKGIDLDWNAATNLMSHLARRLWQEPLHGAGFWSVNFPSPIPPDALERVRRVPLAPTPVPPVFHRRDMDDDRFWEFTYEEAYWNREAPAESDYAAVCRGDVAVTAVPLFGAGAAGRRRGSERVVINHARRAEPLGKWRPRSE